MLIEKEFHASAHGTLFYLLHSYQPGDIANFLTMWYGELETPNLRLFLPTQPMRQAGLLL